MTDVEDKILDFWNERSTLGDTAGTNDFVLSDIERDFLCETIPRRSRILDVGCGSGVAIAQIAATNDCHGVGIDFSEGMVEQSRRRIAEAGLADRVEIHHCVTPPFPDRFGAFDIVYSQRCLINYTSPDQQRDAVRSAAPILKPGGAYIMIECSLEGGERTNAIRRDLGLEAIDPPWHNLFMHEDEVATWGTDRLRLEKLVHVSSTYHFLSRVVYARLAADKGEELRYDSDINLLARKLPRDIGAFGPVKAWIWRKTT